MKKIIGYKIDKLPYTSLNKVCDLMYYDGPILSHYKTVDKTNIFYYWVDRDENYNRWLVLKVSDEDLNYYLKKVHNLKDLILSNRNDYVFLIDINQDIESENITMIESHNLISEYIPEKDSYYQLEIPDIYNLLLQKFETNTYIETLRKNAIFFRLQPADAKYGSTVGLENIREFIKNIINSYKGYFDFDFFNKFNEIYTDLNKLQKVKSKLWNLLTPRSFDYSSQSFGIGIASDTVMGNIQDIKLINWRREILKRYKNDVIDLDYSDLSAINKINEKYTYEQKKEIFDSYFKIVNNPEYKISYAEKKCDTFKKLKKVSEKHQNIIIPQPKVKDEVPEMELKNIVLEWPKNKELKSIPGRYLENRLISSESISDTKLLFTLKDFQKKELDIPLKKDVKCNLHFKNNIYSINFPILDILIQNGKLEKLKGKFVVKFYNLYKEIFINNYQEFPESYKKFINQYL